MPRGDAFVALVQRYKTQDGTAGRLTLEQIQSYPDAANRLMSMVFGSDQRATLRALADLCKKKLFRETAAPMIEREADRLLSIVDDKARKTAYVLIGLTVPDACADKLVSALKNEKTRFARPSIILALGNTRTPDKYLESYVIEPGEPKHVTEEREALKKALGKSVTPQVIKQPRLPEWSNITYINRLALIAEMEDIGVGYRSSVLKNAFTVRVADLARLRCYEDALYDIGTIGEYEAASKALDSLGCNGARYRVEAGSLPLEQRRDAIRSISAGLSQFGYEDNPSAYSFEIRVAEGRMFAVFPGDDRFDYRKEAIPASINPVTAASIMRLCRPYMQENARVLDPFCGSGTMLIERAKILPVQTLVGVDISASAIKAACANRKASGLKIALIHGDALQFGASHYDEVISNMPFGIRVSGHAENERLYAAFAHRLGQLLEDGGYAFLLTQEKRLLHDSLRKTPVLRVLHEEVIESGGLSPSLYIIKKERNT